MTNTFYINGVIPQTINFNGAAVSSVYYNNVLVWGIEINEEDFEIEAVSSAVTFASLNPFTMSVTDGLHCDGTIEYSSNGVSWTAWSGEAITASMVNGEYKLLFRGTGNTYVSDIGYSWNITGFNVKCAGDIENLLDYQTVAAGGHPAMGENCYRQMFIRCYALTDVSKLVLSATTLTSGCYWAMFYSCSNLVKAPKLLATELAYWCCFCMFQECSSLTIAPELPATILAEGCYLQMFNKCSNLIKACKLPATTLAKQCYKTMFSECRRLAQVPELPATTLANECYYQMFYWTDIEVQEIEMRECPNEYRIPSSGTIETSYSNAFTRMFDYITIEPNKTYYIGPAVIDKPGVPGSSQYPILKTIWPISTLYATEGSNASGLTEYWELTGNITEIEFLDSYTPIGNETKSWPADIAQTGAITGYRIGNKVIIAGNGSGGICIPRRGHIFDNCSNLTQIKNIGLLKMNKFCSSLNSMFKGCSSLTSIDLSNFISNFDISNVTNMNSMFYGCSSLTSLDLSRFDTSNVTDMSSMFYGCKNLKTIYASRNKWVTAQADTTNMFYDCGTDHVTYV